MGGLFRQYAWVVDLIGILFCSFFLAKIVGIYLGNTLEIKRSVAVLRAAEVGPEERKQIDVSEYKIITDRNIFDATERGTEEQAQAESGTAEPEPIPTGEAVKTGLSLTVLGVLVVGDGRDKRSTATIGGGGGGGKEKGAGGAAPAPAAGGGGVTAGVYAVGDEESFAANTKLTRVQPDRIEFINSGRLEYAEVASDFGENIFGAPKETVASKDAPRPDKEPLVAKDVPGKFTIDQRQIDDAMQNLDRLYTEIRAVPNFSGGKVSGMKILNVKGDSIFAKLGLRRGDVLQRINGIELDVKKGFEIFNQLKDQKAITLDLIRQGQPTTLDYEIR